MNELSRAELRSIELRRRERKEIKREEKRLVIIQDEDDDDEEEEDAITYMQHINKKRKIKINK